ncbi:MAG: hypothetical protein PHD46_04730 [Eubacteriales bacterium]|nr:hypothetical protein [Eubacteriales bacterium]MDD4422322.1 hypothetical protein [Eubacteriales bacterium]
MRMTNRMMSNSYLKNLNNSLEKMNETNYLITAERSYMKLSDDPATALKAMKVRKSLSRIEIYENNLSDAQGIIDQYESTISSINSISKEALAQVLQGITGTSDINVKKTVAKTLRGFQETILAAANTKYGDDYIFGGDQVGKAPFSLDGSGNLLYNGQNVETGTFHDEFRYIDVGIGLDVDASGNVAPKSAFNVSTSGAVLLGTGVDGNGITNNLHNLLGDIAEKFENDDLSDIQLYSDKLNEKASDIRIQYVSIGAKSDYISFFSERLYSEKTNAAKRQSELEGINLEEAIIIFSEQELAYNACLQMGSKLLQPSLMDYLR